MLKQCKVLLVEDEKIDAIGVGRVLKEFYPAVRLEILGTGEQALEWVHRYRHDGQRIALILMDMSLPRMHGLELISEIRTNKDLSHAPVVVLSGNDAADAIQHAYRSGACGYVVKQTDFREMNKILQRTFDFWLGTNRFLDS